MCPKSSHFIGQWSLSLSATFMAANQVPQITGPFLVHWSCRFQKYRDQDVSKQTEVFLSLAGSSRIFSHVGI